jgi:hypothetical protein
MSDATGLFSSLAATPAIFSATEPRLCFDCPVINGEEQRWVRATPKTDEHYGVSVAVQSSYRPPYNQFTKSNRGHE